MTLSDSLKDKDLPIIDLNKVGQGEIMVEACLKHGFFYIDNRQGQVVDLNIVNQLQHMSQEFFDNQLAIKANMRLKNLSP